MCQMTVAFENYAGFAAADLQVPISLYAAKFQFRAVRFRLVRGYIGE